MTATARAASPAPACVTTRVSGICRRCSQRSDVIHQPIFHTGGYCPKCCPACVPTAPKPPRAPTPGPRPPEPSKPAPKRMGHGQWLDCGYGNPNSDFYRDTLADKALRSTRPPDRWIPRRERWFPGRR